MKGLDKKEREQIFSLFREHFELKFNEVEKQLKIRSNMVAYHLEQMVKDGLLQKKGTTYSLSSKGEQYLPHLAHITKQELAPLLVLLIAPIKDKKVFLIQRNSRPYKGYWGLIGGKMRFGETLADCCERKMLDEANISGKMEALRAIVHEQVLEEKSTKHSFLLLFATAKVKKKKAKDGKWFDLKKIEELNIIPSDLWLLQNKLSEKIPYNDITMQENERKMHKFTVR